MFYFMIVKMCYLDRYIQFKLIKYILFNVVKTGPKSEIREQGDSSLVELFKLAGSIFVTSF